VPFCFCFLEILLAVPACLHPVCLLNVEMHFKSLALLACASCALAHGNHDHDQTPIAGPHKSLWYNTLPGDGGTQVRKNDSYLFFWRACTCIDQTQQADSVFSGISTFGRLPYFPCLASDEEKYDIAFLGTLTGTPEEQNAIYRL
jgi:agmatinase